MIFTDKFGAPILPVNKESITVPLKFEGFDIGTAVVTEGGTVFTAKLNSSAVGKELQDIIMCGMVDGFSIRPNYIPAIQKEKEH